MDHPIQDLCGHLTFADNGAVWATWRLQGQAYGRRATSEKEHARSLHQMLYRSLGGESLHLGFEVDTDPVQVVRDMLRGLDRPLDQLPEWAAEVEATTERLESDLMLSERTYWLSVPLRNAGVSIVGEAVRASTTSLLTKVGAPRRAPATGVLAERLQQAADIQAIIPGPFQPRPATAAEIVWLYRHAQTRGLGREDTWLPQAPSTSQIAAALAMAEDDFGALAHSASPGRIGRPIIDEAASTDLPPGPHKATLRQRMRRLLPAQRKVVKIIDSEDGSASYQSMAVLAGTPTGGSLFPGTEWLGNAESAGVPVDWAVRMRNTAREAVLSRNQRAVRNLNDQLEQREGEVSTGSHELDAVASALTEYQSRLATDKLEVELETITIFATSAPTREQALAFGAELVRHYASFDFRLERPLGEQKDAWAAMLPGTAWPTRFKDLAQLSLAEGFSAAVPVVSSALGDGRGALWAVNETTCATSPIHIDLFATILANFSAAVAIAGELGSGKSYALKSLGGALVDRGARLATIDRSKTAEYVFFGRSLGSCTVAAVVDNPEAGVTLEWSLDALRIFPGTEGARITQNLLTPLLSIEDNSNVDLALTQTTEPAYRQAHGIDSLDGLTDHLLDPACTVIGASDLGRKLRGLRTKGHARVLFDQSLPPLDLHSSRALVFTTYGLQLPTHNETINDAAARKMKPEKNFGRAMYALLMALIRSVAFADPNELVVFICDECHHLTASVEGAEELETFVREGRKQGAAVALGSQDCATDFGSETLRGLIPYRLVMRLTDKNLALKALDWIGLEPSEEHLEEITGDLSPRDPNDPDGKVAPERRGEGLFRDSYRRIGRVRVLGPALQVRRTAYSTTPEERASLQKGPAPSRPAKPTSATSPVRAASAERAPRRAPSGSGSRLMSAAAAEPGTSAVSIGVPPAAVVTAAATPTVVMVGEPGALTQTMPAPLAGASAVPPSRRRRSSGSTASAPAGEGGGTSA